MKYFLHDTNALDDEKVTELFMKFGYEGVGLFYCILEKLAKQEKPIKTTVLKKQLEVGKKLEKCWVFMEEITLIYSSNGETFNKQLLNFSEKYKIKKENNAKRISDWREKQQVTENVTRNKSVRNTTNSKVYNNIDISIRREAFKNALSSFISKYQKEMLNDFYRYWTEPNQSKTKMRFELEKTWDLTLRLSNWDKGSNKSDFKKQKNYQLDFSNVSN